MSSSSPTSRPSRDWLRIRRLPVRSLLFDLAFGAIITPYLFITAARVNFPFEEPFWVYVIEGLAVALRRVWTIPAAVATLVVSGTAEVAHWPYPLGVAVLVYTLGASRFPRWFGWVYALTSAALLSLPTTYVVIERTPVTLSQIIPEALVVTIVPLLLGIYARQRQDLIDTLRRQSEYTARERELEGERIRADERSRLANEIHDVVAHSVSLMIVHSGALKLASADERTREIAEKIRNTGRMALEELREMVGVLRHGDSAPLGPAPNLANLGGLIDESRTAGTKIELHSRGTPRKVSGAVERTAYRVVQEALTNARKHAAGAPVRVDLSWSASSLDIAVRNDPPPAEGGLAFPGSGYGLESLRERVNLLSGVFTSGPTNEGGWRVYASLPTGGGGQP